MFWCFKNKILLALFLILAKSIPNDEKQPTVKDYMNLMENLNLKLKRMKDDISKDLVGLGVNDTIIQKWQKEPPNQNSCSFCG